MMENRTILGTTDLDGFDKVCNFENIYSLTSPIMALLQSQFCLDATNYRTRNVNLSFNYE